MKAKIKKARKRMRIVRKTVYFLLMIGAVYYAAVSLYPKWTAFYASYRKVDTAEIDKYYDLLAKRARPSGELLLDLGVKQGDPLQPAVDRLKGAMGLGDHKIWLAHHDAEKPPAYIKTLGYGDMGILLSRKITERREEINLLVHELCHIYVWRLDPSVFEKCDQEKLVDCSGVFLGLGVLTLNGLTDEFRILPGEGYKTEQKFYGYLKPEQFGYLVARYCADHGIADEAVMRFLEPTGRKYFEIGRGHLKKAGYSASRSAGPVVGIYWCPKCGTSQRLSLSGKIEKVECPKCGFN